MMEAEAVLMAQPWPSNRIRLIRAGPSHSILRRETVPARRVLVGDEASLQCYFISGVLVVFPDQFRV
jgi:hypothetical protein